MESSANPQRIPPTAPVAAYLGGKRNLAGRIVPRLDAWPHVTYVEPFVGMGGIFLRRRTRSRCEVINDISADVTTLFRILQRHYVAFMDVLKWQVTSRAEFQRLVAANPETMTDLERAARFLYLQRLAFGGKVMGRNFGVSVGLPGRFDVVKLAPMLDELHERLSGVIIERLPYPELMARYDRPDTLFYLDPPYWGCEADYGLGVFTTADFQRLAKLLEGLKGQFMLSINDCPAVREIFAAFQMEAVETSYGIGPAKSARVGELLVTRRPPTRRAPKRPL